MANQSNEMFMVRAGLQNQMRNPSYHSLPYAAGEGMDHLEKSRVDLWAVSYDVVRDADTGNIYMFVYNRTGDVLGVSSGWERVADIQGAIIEGILMLCRDPMCWLDWGNCRLDRYAREVRGHHLEFVCWWDPRHDRSCVDVDVVSRVPELEHMLTPTADQWASVGYDVETGLCTAYGGFRKVIPGYMQMVESEAAEL